jgi:hypothetical protein
VFRDMSGMFGVRSEVYRRCHRQYPGDNGTPLKDNNGVSRSSTGMTFIMEGTWQIVSGLRPSTVRVQIKRRSECTRSKDTGGGN